MCKSLKIPQLENHNFTGPIAIPLSLRFVMMHALN